MRVGWTVLIGRGHLIAGGGRLARKWRRLAAAALLLVGAVYLFRAVGRLRHRRHPPALEHRYDHFIRESTQRHGIAPDLVRAVIWQESRFRPNSVGEANEVGLMQITKGAVSDWKDCFDRPMPARSAWFDPALNIEVGTWYLARAMRRWRDYRSAEILALAEYNAGRSRARKWAPDNPQQELTLDRISVSSTRQYIKRVRSKWHEFEKEPPSGE